MRILVRCGSVGVPDGGFPWERGRDLMTIPARVGTAGPESTGARRPVQGGSRGRFGGKQGGGAAVRSATVQIHWGWNRLAGLVRWPGDGLAKASCGALGARSVGKRTGRARAGGMPGLVAKALGKRWKAVLRWSEEAGLGGSGGRMGSDCEGGWSASVKGRFVGKRTRVAVGRPSGR